MSVEQHSVRYNMLSAEIWIRLAFMVVFAVMLKLAIIVLAALTVIQFLLALITGAPNGNLTQFGASTSRFVFQAWRYLSFASEEKPFPFQDWPEQ